jgi:putative PIN family toxin of toxin-antitoxin system
MIVVLDTNVWVSALVFGGGKGTPFRALARAATDHTMATCRELESEIQQTLKFGFAWPDARIEAVLTGTLRRAIRVTIHGTVQVCRDPADNKILECAERANAQVIVTGDNDLLSLNSYGSTRILRPADYLQL